MEKHQVVRFTISDNDFSFLLDYTAKYLANCLGEFNYSEDTPEQIIHEFWDLMHVDKELLKYFNEHLKVEILDKLPAPNWENSEVYYIYFDYSTNRWHCRCD